jgi:hypothetical protein
VENARITPTAAEIKKAKIAEKFQQKRTLRVRKEAQNNMLEVSEDDKFALAEQKKAKRVRRNTQNVLEVTEVDE